MRINCHAHIFNLQSVITRATIEAVLNRIKDMDLPPVIAEALRTELTNAITNAGSYVDEDQILRSFVGRIRSSDAFADFAKVLTPQDKKYLGAIDAVNLENIAVKGLLEFVEWIEKKLQPAGSDARRTTIIDIIDFLRIALQPNIRKVTDILMDQLAGDDAVVTLMMDITRDGSEQDLFLKQLADTAAMTLAYPGRIFPFIAVNPNRPDHFTIMTDALEHQGFVGVKLYPSLGYDIDSPAMNRVYAYCEQNDIPMLMHCSRGGFYFADQCRDNSKPDKWKNILQNHGSLRICFGHFGGGEQLMNEAVDPASWTGTILDLMQQFPGVYADVSFQTKPMGGGDSEKKYVVNLKKLLTDPVRGGRILFGTDYFLVRVRLKEESYWSYFDNRLGAEDFQKMVEGNAATFLGLRTAATAPRKNIEQHVRFLYGSRNQLERGASSWLNVEVKALFGETATLPDRGLGAEWTWNNEAHGRTWSIMQDQMRPADRNLPFADAGRLRMRQMQYWNKEFEDGSIWNRKLVAMAKTLDSGCRANKAIFEPGYDVKKALGELQDAFNKGDLALYKLAAFCDRIYKFRREV